MRLFKVSSELPSLPSSMLIKNIGLFIIPLVPIPPPIIDCIIIISIKDDDESSEELVESEDVLSPAGMEPVSVEEEPVESEEVEEEESSKSESAKRGEIPPIPPAPPIPPRACIIIISFNVESSFEFEFIIDSINGLNPIVDAARHAKSFIVGVIVAKIWVMDT